MYSFKCKFAFWKFYLSQFFLNLTSIQFGPEHIIYNHYTTVKCDFLPLSSFRSISACSSSRSAASCCRLTCSTTAETWWGKRRPGAGRLPDRRWRPSTTVGPMATSLTAMGWMLWRLRSTQWNRGPLQDLCFNVPCSLIFLVLCTFYSEQIDSLSYGVFC